VSAGDGTLPVIRLVVADDQRAVREAIVTVLGLYPDLQVVGDGADGAEAVALVEQHRPDVALLDLNMPRLDGVEATRQIAERHPETRVVVLTTYADDQSVLAALRAGAVGYLTKDAGRDQIVLAVRSAAAGQSVLDPAVHAALLAALGGGSSASAAIPTAPAPALAPPSGAAAGRRADVPLPDGLTRREAEVLARIAAGRTNQEIAGDLFVSETTVKTHINNVFSKAGLRSRAEAVRYAYEHGLTD
jgi:DNA-binding NarL/FixJ family response regulator